MTDNSHDKPLLKSSHENKSENSHVLLLFNDDINTFEYVIESLVEVCDHTGIQAEQCAIIAHYKGKSEVRTGELNVLERMRSGLSQRGLISIIE